MSQSMSTDTTPPPSNEYLSFTLGNEQYGVDILNVQEIRGYDGVVYGHDRDQFQPARRGAGGGQRVGCD